MAFIKRKCTILFLIISFLLFQCNPQSDIEEVNEVNSIQSTDYKNFPVISAGESIDKIDIQDGFEVKLVASEPLVMTPIALDFDTKGRMWVGEMDGYMPDTSGIGEEEPNGKIIVIFRDDFDYGDISSYPSLWIQSPERVILIDYNYKDIKELNSKQLKINEF